MGARNLHVLTILRHGSAGYLDSLALQLGGKLVVGQGFAGVFLLDQLLHLALQQNQGKVSPSGPLTPSEKKKRSS